MAMSGPMTYMLVALLACFLGTIPFGPINLTVVKTTVDFDRRRGLQVALAAAFVEIGQALVAIWFGMVISRFLESNVLFKLLVATAFIVLALIVLFRSPALNGVRERAGEEDQSLFRRGLLIAALNPQAIPFWIFALAAISQSFLFEYAGINLLAFLLGVFLGKFLALAGFALASAYLKTHLEQSSVLVNRVLAAVLLFIGASQLYSALPLG